MPIQRVCVNTSRGARGRGEMDLPGASFADGSSTGLPSVASRQSLAICLPFSVTIYVVFTIPSHQGESLNNVTGGLKENGAHFNEHEKRENSKCKNSHLT
jgi:hypothetical protein